MTKHHDFIIIKAEIARLFFKVSKNVQGFVFFFFFNKGMRLGTDQSWGVFSSTSDCAAFQFQFSCWNKCSIPRAQQLAVLQPDSTPEQAIPLHVARILRLTAQKLLSAPACWWGAGGLCEALTKYPGSRTKGSMD